MTLGERIAHVGGHITDGGTVEFGSAMAVDALIKHVLRDVRSPVIAAETVASPDLYFFGDHEHGFECPDDMEIVSGRKLGEHFTLKAAWYADREFEVTKVPDDTDDDYEVREVAAPQPPAQGAYDGNHVENHCAECGEYESECSCAQAAAPADVPITWWHEKAEQFVMGGWDKQPFAKGFVPLFRRTADQAAIARDASKVPSLTDNQRSAIKQAEQLAETMGYPCTALILRALLQGDSNSDSARGAA
jgi:hypothetical protein